MNIKKFKEIMNALPDRSDLMQEAVEWQVFLEFADGYFKSRDIVNPLVVEIGIYRDKCRTFYEQLLGAEYISIDIDPQSKPDILGDSNDPETLRILSERLAGRNIDLLFIDGNHSYEAAKQDYELYSPLTKHLVAFHDALQRRDQSVKDIQVYRLWEEILAKENTILFKGEGWITPGRQTPQGIGLILKGA